MSKRFIGLMLICVMLMGVFSGTVDANVKLARNGDVVSIITYHDFGPSPIPSHDKLYKVTPEEFEGQIIALKNAGYNFIDDFMLNDYYYKGVPLPNKPVLITVDDGYKSTYEYMFPILKKHNAKATVYLITSYIDTRDEFLTSDMVKEMAASGAVSFQMHTHDHHRHVSNGRVSGPALTHMKQGETYHEYWQRLYTDLLINKQQIERLTGRTPVSITYPFGAGNETAESVLRFIDINIGFVGFNQINNRSVSNTLRLKRHNIEHGVNGRTLINRIR